jgi:SulP family sulfate permease
MLPFPPTSPAGAAEPAGSLRVRPPLIDDLRALTPARAGGDLLAGSITAVLLVPQALAYALLAGLPPEMGLYASILPPVVYAFLGSSRTLAVGPVAVAAAMVASALYGWAGDDRELYIQGAILLAALSGVLLLAMAALRLGWLTHFISHPVLSGFVTGAAIFIVGTQITALIGAPGSGRHDFLGEIRHLVAALPQANGATAAFGLVSLLLLALARSPLQRLLTRAGMAAGAAAMVSRLVPLVVVIVATLVSALIGAEAMGVRTVGGISADLPIPDLGMFRSSGWWQLLPSALLIALVGYVESVSVARSLALRRREAIDANQELIGLGGANIAAALSGAMPTAGGFSRSMVNFDAGARSQLAALVTAGWVLLITLFFGGLLAPLPYAVLAAIIVVAVWQLIDLGSLAHTWRFDRGDGVAQALTLGGVLALGIEGGLVLGVAFALAVFLYRTSRPHIAVVGRVPGTEHFRNIHRHVVDTWPERLIVRIDESLYFASSPRVYAELQALVTGHDSALADVVLVLSGVNAIDASGLDMLAAFHDELQRLGIRLHLAEIKGPVQDHLERSDLLASIGAERLYLSTQAAVEALASDSRAG